MKFGLRLIDQHRGFTLLELLVVLSIIALLSAVSIPAVSALSRSLSLNQATNTLSQALEEARVNAQSRNRAVEVRFYLKTPGSMDVIAVQPFWINDSGVALEAVSKRKDFPESVVVVTSNQSSSLLTTLIETSDSKNLPYRAFRFRPDGSADLLSSSEQVMTLANQGDVVRSGGALPANFASIQVNPLTGRARLFRP